VSHTFSKTGPLHRLLHI